MLSSASKYALQIVIHLAKNKEKGKIGGKQIAKELDLSAPFVGKVLQPLAHSGIIKSTKGPNGGFTLNLSPDEISLFDVIQIYEGDNAFRECLLDSGNCKSFFDKNNGESCQVHHEVAPARNQLLESLKGKAISDFLEDETFGEEALLPE